ncbi:MAG: ABC transporter permease [bacterium]|nr:ABC transporter permease [bacterium]
MAVGVRTSTTPSYTKEKRRGAALALPAVIWLGLFFVLPLLIVMVISFLTRGRTGVQFAPPITIDNYADIFSFPYIDVYWSSIGIAVVTTILCLIIGYPLAFFIATRKSRVMQNLSLFLVILPFWTNFLVRTYAIKVILGADGPINTTLLNLGLIAEPLTLVNTQFAVLLGLTYSYLPFMVLPIYASVERFEFRLVEAAYDLGANDIRAFLRVVLPLTLPGVVAGSILVLIPTIGAFITPDILGGTQGLMIGNLISAQFRGTGNWPRGSAASMVMLLLVMVALLAYVFVNARSAANSRPAKS